MQSSRILIVEDDNKMREALMQIMAREKYEVTTAASGEEALKIFKNQHFDLVISDLKLPGIDGMEVLNAIHAFRPETGIIIITAYDDPANRLVGKLQGVHSYLIKPFSADEIERTVSQAISSVTR